MKGIKIDYWIIIVLCAIFLQGCKPMTAPSFQKFTPSQFPNYYLVCPDQFCSVTPNAISPIYPVSAEELFYAFNQVVSEQPRTSFVYSMPETGQYTLVQKSLVFGFPDDISVQFIAVSENQSTLAIISQSRYGFYDFGMNKRRLDSWLQQLGQIVAARAETDAKEEGIATEPSSPTSEQ